MASRKKLPPSVVTRERGAKGRFVRVTTFADEFQTGRGRKNMGGYVIINTAGLRAAPDQLAQLNKVVGQAVLNDPDRRAAQIQARLRLATALAYNRSATGRVSRGIFAKVQKIGTPDGKGVQTAIVVSMINYREVKFLTNLGGEGYFKRFPIQPYRIFAKGAEGLDDLSNPSTGITSKTSKKKAIGLALSSEGVGRLKVPRGSAFFTSRRQQGRGGGESRFINNILGEADFKTPDASFPNLTKDKQGEFFFYPLWVNHPGFPQDVISEVALQEGSTFTNEAVDAVVLALETSEKIINKPNRTEGGVFKPAGPVGTGKQVKTGVELPPSVEVVSGIIPLPGTEVMQAAESGFIGMARRSADRAIQPRGFTNQFGELLGTNTDPRQGNFSIGYSGRRRR